MTDQYPPNPPRLCGTKRPGFYVEADMGATGSLAAITWLLGTHVAGSTNCLTAIPARAMVAGNLPASLIEGEFVSADVPYLQGLHVQGAQSAEALAKRMAYDKISQAAAPVALFDHVGSNNYTPHEFASELAEYGPSRRVPKTLALQVAQAVNAQGALPIVFTHSDLPMFGDLETRDRAMALAAQAVYGYDPEAVYTVATWHRDGWGMYASHVDRGRDHYLVAILGAMARIRRQPSLASGITAQTWQPLAEALAQVPTAEAPFCASWITKVTHVTDGPPAPQVAEEMAQRGIDILDLSELD